ncbi:YdcF family protein [Rhodanobacter sp. Col0626]|uniref:YdcF family protein n=1 Tax=Rhodanobacter sp. Col0626 TaxID=3415679 RepID=UPI003CF718CF
MNFVEQLAHLSHPMLQAGLLAAPGLLLLRWRRFRLAGGLLGLAVLWIWLCATPAFAGWLQHGLERQYVQRNASAYATADAIVVLGGGKLPSGADWVPGDVHGRATRLGFGLQLFRDSRAGIILLSGEDQARKMRLRLQEQGVPASALLMEDESANTHQNALFSARLLKHEKLQRILLVTSGIHMPRAAACFTRQGLTVIPAPVPDSDGKYRQVGHSWWPKRKALSLSTRCMREYLGLWSYRLLGWA